MKRHAGLYEQIYSFSNIEDAYKKARRCKRYRAEVLKYSANLEENLVNLQNHLIWKSFKQGEQKIFVIHEPKERVISALPFRDRVAHHAINNIIEPIFDRRFYFHSYACRRGRGMHAASKTLTQWIRNLSFDGESLFAIKADIKSYFASIDHNRLKKILRRTIKDLDVLWLLDVIIDDGGENGRGIPVGNLTSQLFANIYLDALDTYIKQNLKMRHYIRYMDDFVILSPDKRKLKAMLKKIDDFLYGELGLLLNPKTTILNVKNGIDFCGFRHYCDYKKVRKRSAKHMRQAIKANRSGKMSNEKFIRSYTSWKGHVKHADTFKLQVKILEEIQRKSE